LSWNKSGENLCIGSEGYSGYLELVIPERNMQLYSQYLISGIYNKVNVSDWKDDNIFCCGNDNGTVFVFDTRTRYQIKKMKYHSHKIVGMKWSPDGRYILSGGDDDKILVHDNYNDKKIFESNEHKSAVKALSWCPGISHKFVSGGGTNDKTIKIWNLNKNTDDSKSCLLTSKDTNEQVCFVNWSEINPNEIISTHGYSGNSINVWRLHSQKEDNNNKHDIEILNTKKWTGHQNRILHAIMNSYGDKLITGCPNESIRFWNIYNSKKHNMMDNTCWNTCIIR